MAVSAKRVTIQTTTGTSVTLKIKAATRITVDDRPARVSDLKIGQSVDAHYKPATMVATLIDVQRSVP
jgi:hypothetical protein